MSARACVRNIADIGTGTGLLAFAALECGRRLSDRERHRRGRGGSSRKWGINGAKPAHGAGELLLAQAAGWTLRCSPRARLSTLSSPTSSRGRWSSWRPDFANALAPGGTIVLAGLLDTQAGAVTSAYERFGLTVHGRGSGEWPVLVLTKPPQLR